MWVSVAIYRELNPFFCSGHHRHGATATTSGHRINLFLWCRRFVILPSLVFFFCEVVYSECWIWNLLSCSSVYRDLKEHKNDFIEFRGEWKRSITLAIVSGKMVGSWGLEKLIIFSLCQSGLGLTTLLQ